VISRVQDGGRGGVVGQDEGVADCGCVGMEEGGEML
jgi:hypothetical protein